MRKAIRFFALFLLCLACLVSAVSCQTVAKAPSGPDPDGSYTSLVYYTGDDAGKLTVRFLGLRDYVEDTYPGDCAIYTSPEGLIMMVDCGNQISYEELFPALDAMGITDIDIFVMSHPHADHIGSLAELAKHYNIKKMYKNYVDYKSDLYKGTMQVIEDLGIETEILYEGDSFKFGEFVDVQVFNPPEGQTVEMSSAPSVNHSSIAMRLTYGESSIWTSADLYIVDEMALVKKYGDQIQSDIVKMNHHGRETSNSKDYINTLQPKIAVATQGELSSLTIMNWYRTSGAVAFHSAIDGTIRISTTGDGHYDIQTQYVRTKKNLYGTPSEDGHYVL